MHQFYRFILGELRGAWRFRWYALGVAWLVALAGAFAVLTMPDQYRAEARVQIDTESLLQPLLVDLAVAPNLQTRMQLLTATLLHRENLERIAEQNDLRARTPADEDRMIESLRAEISIVRAGDQIYRISYQSASPERSRGVVKTVVGLLMEGAMDLPKADATSATQFLERQVEEHANRLRSAEEQLARFKRENAALLPGRGGQDFYQRLWATENDLEDLESALRSAHRRAESLREQLAALISGATNPRIVALDERILERQEQLDLLVLRFSESHPEVRNLAAQVARLEENRERLLAESPAPEPHTLETNPVYQELQIQLNDWEGEIAALESQIEEKRIRKERLLTQVDEITDVEARLTDLTRDYEVTRGRHQTLLNRLSTAEMTAQAEASPGQMSVRLVDSPRAPEEPDGPPRDLFLVALLPISFGVGGGFAFLLHQLRPVFQTRDLLAELTARPVLGSVSLVMTRNQRRARLGAIAAYGLGAATLVGAGVTGAMFADVCAEQLQDVMGSMPF